MFEQFFRFCVVGTLGLVIDFGITFLLKEKIRINKYIANSFGFIVAATSNYIFNRWWTFENTDSNIASQYSSFILISLVGLAMNNVIIVFLTRRLKLNFYVSKIIAIAIVTLWNFFGNKYITFHLI